MSDIAYVLNGSLYLNITNRCTNSCHFCIRYKSEKFEGEHSLWLQKEPKTEEIIKEIGDPSKYKQIVFCGYGESLIRLNTVKEVASWIKSQDKKAFIRVDTNGQANLFHGRNILPELKGLVDKLSISLNAQNSEVYQALCNSFFGEDAYSAVIAFIKEAKKEIPEVEVSSVDIEGVDKEKSKKIAADLGVSFRIREYYEEKYKP